MTQEDKELLLNDLCGRLPNGVIGRCEIDASYDTSFDTIFQTHKFNAEVYGIKEDLLLVTPLIEDNDEQTFAEEEVADGVAILDFTPYLFPMSSMTDEQKKEYEKVCELDTEILSKHPMDGTSFPALYNSQDWLNKNHFDYRGLIQMGLALDATNLNIYTDF